MSINSTPPAQTYLRAKTICAKYGISKSTFWLWVKQREGFPKPIKAGERVTLFDAAALEKFIAGVAA